MQEITTHKSQKKVLVDGFGYEVRRPGAGESLSLSQLSREITRLEEKDQMSDEETKEFESMTERAIKICLSLFNPLDDKAKAYIDTLEVDILINTIGQIYGKADTDAPAPTIS